MLRIETAEVDVVGRVHDNRDDMALADPHHGLHVAALLRKHSGLEHLRGKVLRVGVDVLHQSLKIRDLSSWHEGGTTPVMQHRSGKDRILGGREALNDKFSAAKAKQVLGGPRGKEGILRLVLLGQTRLQPDDIQVEFRESGWGRFGECSAGNEGDMQEEEHDRGSAQVHELFGIRRWLASHVFHNACLRFAMQ